MTLSDSLATWRPVRGNDVTLAAQLADDLARRIADEGLRPGSRLPSIRAMAEQAGVSRFTVVEAYDRLAASGLVQSRRGAGFFVAPRDTARAAAAVPAAEASLDTPARIDISWLLRSMFRESNTPGMPGGAGLLPADWLDADMIAGAVRAVGRSVRGNFLSYGQPQGYPGLRQQIAALLQGLGVPAHPDHNLLTTSGVTHGLDLIARLLVGPGDTVLVEDPAWFVIFGRLAAVGARVIGVPRTAAGPDIDVLEKLAAQHRPKLFIVNSVVHNPTGHTLSAGAAYDILRIAERYDFSVIEDDTYSELHPGNAMRLSVLDRLNRVILVGGFSKMLAPSLRVGYVAAAPALLQKLADLKMLAGLTTPELGERVIHRILADGLFRRHVERVRARVDEARERCVRLLLELGLRIPELPHAGMFIWADCGRDSETLARAAAERNMLLAPGSLFSPSQAPTTYMRFSASMVDNAAAWQLLRQLMPHPAGRDTPAGRLS
ncbi:GntR family transcriptional regulator [Bordetella genomosp. 8]|uniref:GntR family transcriptional regulator n=1 Tax=Bordetella genomosp. 8 TaxID=1416806 RepID=A0A1W6YRM8_9BORD|nr:GntR family transcriptional regulator [Bordetella genomosp. 8]